MTDVADLQAGTLTTIAATAHVGTSKPAVAVPLVDRHYDERPELLWEAVYSLVAEDVEDKQPTVGVWQTYLGGSDSERGAETAMVCRWLSKEVNYLREEAKKFATHHPESILREACRASRGSARS